MNLSRFSPYLLLLPSALIIFGLVLYPVGYAVRLSLFRSRGLGGQLDFVGIGNYTALFADPLFRQILLQTLIWTVLVVGLTMLTAMAIALFLNVRFSGRRMVRAIVIIPWGTSLALSAVMWRWVFEPSIGMVNEILRGIGVIEGNIGWFGSPLLAFGVVVLVGVWVSVPFSTLGILAGLQAIPTSVREAAQLDGAQGFSMARHVTLPMIRPVISVILILNLIAVFNSFPIIWILTRGGPLNATDIIVTFLYKNAFTFLDFGLASAMAIIVFFILMLVSFGYIRLIGVRR